MAARGTPIEGWWAWWPFHGAECARRFSSDADAYAYLPNVKTKQGNKPPMGDKLVMRVAWDYDKNEWSNDAPIRITEREVAQQWQVLQEEEELRKTQKAAALPPAPPDERPATPQLEFLVSISPT